MAVDPKAPPLPLVMQYPVLPVVMRPRSPEDIALSERWTKAVMQDQLEVIIDDVIQCLPEGPSDAAMQTPEGRTEMRKRLLAEVRPNPAPKQPKPPKRPKATKAEALAAIMDEARRIAPMVKDASILAGNPKARISDKRVDDLRPYLPKEEQGARVRALKEALRIVRVESGQEKLRNIDTPL